MATKMRQELPPPGGYGPIEWAKKAPKRGIGGYASFGIMGAMTAAGLYLWYRDVRRRKVEDLLQMDGRVALEPFILAEQCRSHLKQCRKNRDDEAELMKDVPGWKVGTWQGSPVYHSTSYHYPYIPPEEFYIHNSWHTAYNRVFDRRKH